MAAVVNGAVDGDKLTLLRAHPDLAGKLALAELTHSSQNEQTGAGLDQCTPDELARFTQLNDDYKRSSVSRSSLRSKGSIGPTS